MTNTILVIDLETTGFDPETDHIIEIGATSHPLRQRDFDGQSDVPFRLSALVFPPVPIPAASSAVHHITDWHVRKAPILADVLDDNQFDLKRFPIWAAHNARFEESFLTPQITPRGLTPKWICTYKCAVHLWPELPTHSNGGLFYALGIFDENPERWSGWLRAHSLHRAFPDAVLTRQILKRILAEMSVDDALRISANPVLLPRVPFGKYRGTAWSEMDTGFLEWVLGKDFSEDVLHTAQHWLDAINDEGDTA